MYCSVRGGIKHYIFNHKQSHVFFIFGASLVHYSLGGSVGSPQQVDCVYTLEVAVLALKEEALISRQCCCESRSLISYSTHHVKDV